MNYEAREILYKQLLEMRENNILENAQKLIDEEEFYRLQDTEAFRYVFWYRDTQTKFPEDQVYVIELPDINLKGANLAGVYLSFFQVGVQNREERKDSISSMNLSDSGAVVSLSTVLYNSKDGVDFFDFTKSNFEGCVLYGDLKGPGKMPIQILGNKNLDGRYLSRRIYFNTSDFANKRKVSDRVYAKLLANETIARVRGINTDISLSDYDFPFLTESQRNFIYTEIKDKKIDVYNSDLYRRYGIINTYSISKHYDENLDESLRRIIYEYSKSKDDKVLEEEINRFLDKDKRSYRYLSIAKSVFEKAKNENEVDAQRTYLEFTYQLLKRLELLNKTINPNMRDGSSTELSAMIEYALKQAKGNTELSQNYRDFMYKTLSLKGNQLAGKIFAFAYSNNEEKLLLEKYDVLPRNKLFLAEELKKYYKNLQLIDFEESIELRENFLKLYKANKNRQITGIIINIILKNKDYGLLKDLLLENPNKEVLDICLRRMYSTDDLEEIGELRKVINSVLEREKINLLDISIMSSLNKDGMILGNNIRSFYYRELSTEEERKKYLENVLKRAYPNKAMLTIKEEQEADRYKKILEHMMSVSAGLNFSDQAILVEMASTLGYKKFVEKYCNHLTDSKLKKEFVEEVIAKYSKLPDSEKDLFFKKKLKDYYQFFGEVVIEVISEKGMIDAEKYHIKQLLLDSTTILSSETIEAIRKLNDEELDDLIKNRMSDYDKLKAGLIPLSETLNVLRDNYSAERIRDFLKTMQEDYDYWDKGDDTIVVVNRNKVEIRSAVKEILSLPISDKSKKIIAVTLLNMGDSFTIRNYLNMFYEQELIEIVDVIGDKIEAKKGNVENLVRLYGDIAQKLKIGERSFSDEEREIVDNAITSGKHNFLREIFDKITDKETKADTYFYLMFVYCRDGKETVPELEEFLQRNYDQSVKYKSVFTKREPPLRVIINAKKFEFLRGIPNIEEYPVENVILQFEDFLAGKPVEIEKKVKELLSEKKVKKFQKRELLKYLRQIPESVIDELPDEKSRELEKSTRLIFEKYGNAERSDESIVDTPKKEIKEAEPKELLMNGQASPEIIKKLLKKEKQEAKTKKSVYPGKLLQEAIFDGYPVESILKLIELGANPNGYLVFINDDEFFPDEKKEKSIIPVIFDALEIRDPEKREIVVKALLKAGANPDSVYKTYERNVLVKEESARSWQDGLVDRLLEEIEFENVHGASKEAVYARELGMTEENFKRYNRAFVELTSKSLKRRNMKLSEYSLQDLQRRKAIYDVFGATEEVFETRISAVVLSPEIVYNRIKFLTDHTGISIGKNNFVSEVLGSHKKFAMKYGKILFPNEEVMATPEYAAKVRKKISEYSKMPENLDEIKEKLERMIKRTSEKDDNESR